MFRRLDDFFAAWQYESDHTHKLLSALTDASLRTAVANDHRTIGRIGWHIVTTIPEMMNHLDLNVTAVTPDAPMPNNAADIARRYRAVADELLRHITSTWSDATLEQEDEMYGDRWKRGFTLEVLVRHQTHHRGQMTVLMRQAGLTVPGIYGPSRDEWSAFGMTPPEI